jgi:hypothetical protein
MREATMRRLAILGFAAVAQVAWSGMARAQQLTPIPHPIGVPDPTGAALRATATAPASPSRWTPLVTQPTFLFNGASSPILLTDGTVLVQDTGFPDWWRLTPDQTGSYVNGTWSEVASLPAGYSPLYHATAVLPDGRLIIEGGEYLLSDDQSQFVPTWTAKGAIFDPVANVWTAVDPPPFFTGFGPFPQTIGDAASVVLADGTFMLANCCAPQAALLDATTLAWTPTGSGKRDSYAEEGWTLLPNGEVLTVDAYDNAYDPTGAASEIYDSRTGAWTSASSTIAQLWDSGASCGAGPSYEVGPAVLRPDGTVFYVGSNRCGAGHTAIYDSRPGRWRAGPDLPDPISAADGPAALEPNGKVLMVASPFYAPPSEFFEWDGTGVTPIAGPPNAPFDPSYAAYMLVLPTGQILLADSSRDVEIFTPAGAREPDESGERQELEVPVIASAPRRVAPGKTYLVTGRGFNGVSQGAAYGDDAQAATNFPLVRLTNLRTGHVFYCRTHDHSSMAVASREPVSTRFDLPGQLERGRSTLQVVANGVASRPVPVLVQ